jgi:glycosyltransferase involved in cell wall biosynthesis
MADSLLYIANARIPTEKAHGLQIIQNCEAFADTGVDVTLWAARRINTPEMRAIGDPWEYYGVKRNFALRYLPCLDLLSVAPSAFQPLAFVLQLSTFTLAALLLSLFAQADIYYSRDPLVLWALSFIKPRRTLAYEAHRLSSGRGRWLQGQVVRGVGTVIAVTPQLADDLIALGADAKDVLVAHDGVRRERFANAPTQAEARRIIGWPQDVFIVGYVGRLHTLSMDKGLATLIEALRQVEGAALALVGGPDDMAAALRQHWVSLGLDESRFLCAGHVPPERVPWYLSAFDVCAMPHPWTAHFAHHTSPIKLFEYMAARRAIVASDLPGWSDVVQDGETVLLVPPGDPNALAAALKRLRDDPALRERLAVRAYERVMERYTWEARARAILARITVVRQ